MGTPPSVRPHPTTKAPLTTGTVTYMVRSPVGKYGCEMGPVVSGGQMLNRRTVLFLSIALLFVSRAEAAKPSPAPQEVLAP